jgi:hypothetical protein
MIRENSDVFNLFCSKAHNFIYITNPKFTETLVNFLFRDLTNSSSDKKLAHLIRHVIKNETQMVKSCNDLVHGSMSERIFNELVKQSDTKKYLIYLFKQKFEKIDFNYLDLKDVYKIFK